MAGSNDYTGDTNVTGGTLSISSDANLGNGGTVNLAEGTTLSFIAGGTYTHDVAVTGDPIFDTNGHTVTENGQITDGSSPPAGEIVVTGGGTLVLGNAANSYSGGTTVIEGSTVSAAADGDLGAASGGVTLGDATTGGTLATTASFDSARVVTLAVGGGTVDTANGVTTGLSGQVAGRGRADQDRHRHAGPLGRQRLWRGNDGQRRHAARQHRQPAGRHHRQRQCDLRPVHPRQL